MVLLLLCRCQSVQLQAEAVVGWCWQGETPETMLASAGSLEQVCGSKLCCI